MSRHFGGLDKLADANMQKWLWAEHVRERLEKRNIEKNVGPYLTISRETGAGGGEIARQVGEKLGWDVLDRAIIDYMAERYGTPPNLIKFVDEKRSHWIKDVFETWLEGQTFSQATYVHRLTQLFLVAAQHGKVVIVGRGAQFMLPRDRGLSVRILAPLDFRVQRIAKLQNLSASAARKFVEDSDRQRREFVKNYFHHQPDDPHVHDFEVNIDKLVYEDAVNLIIAALQSWMATTGVGIKE